MHSITLPNIAKKAIDILKQNNYQAYAVGGCIRDLCMQKAPNDFDITTNATPDIVKEIFCDFKTFDTGIKHGTITVIIDNSPVEITTYRTEREYSDMRHPTDVSFVDNIDVDLKRRDFTINALAYDGDNFIDLFNGVDDINDKIIRCIGNPEERFLEDALRILRALRFSATIGFRIDTNTKKAILKLQHNLLTVSKERILAEFKKLVMGQNAFEVISEYKEVIELITGRINNLSKTYFLSSDICIRLALLYDERVVDVLNTLKCDKKTINETKTLVKYKYLTGDELQVAIVVDKIGVEAFYRLCEYLDLFNNRGDKLLSVMNDLPIISSKHLALTPKEIIKIGNLKGKEISEEISRLYIAVVTNKCKNEKNQLENFLKLGI